METGLRHLCDVKVLPASSESPKTFGKRMSKKGFCVASGRIFATLMASEGVLESVYVVRVSRFPGTVIHSMRTGRPVGRS